MLQALYKYPLAHTGIVEMPRGATILDVGWQVNEDDPGHVELFVWALVDPAAPLEPRALLIADTGTNGDFSQFRYVGSVHLQAWRRVWHVFEPLPPLTPAARRETA